MPINRLTQELRLRFYRPEDLKTLHQIDVECFGPPFRFSRATLRRFTGSNEAFTLIAEQTGFPENSAPAIAGFVIVHLHLSAHNRFAYVVTLDVKEAFRRTGVAASLMRTAEKLAWQHGAKSLRLHVFVGNEPARRFYQRLEFEVVGQVTGFYSESLDALLLRKDLAELSETTECAVRELDVG